MGQSAQERTRASLNVAEQFAGGSADRAQASPVPEPEEGRAGIRQGVEYDPLTVRHAIWVPRSDPVSVESDVARLIPEDQPAISSIGLSAAWRRITR